MNVSQTTIHGTQETYGHAGIVTTGAVSRPRMRFTPSYHEARENETTNIYTKGETRPRYNAIMTVGTGETGKDTGWGRKKTCWNGRNRSTWTTRVDQLGRLESINLDGWSRSTWSTKVDQLGRLRSINLVDWSRSTWTTMDGIFERERMNH